MKKTKREFIADDIRKSSIKGFDEIIIDIAKSRISQELTISSTLRTRAGILIGIAGVISGILLTGGVWQQITSIVTDRAKDVILQNQPFVLFGIPVALDLWGTSLFFISIVFSFVVILPRRWAAMLDLRELNNALYMTPINESEYKIKCALMRDLDGLLRKNNELAKFLRISYWFFFIGIGMMVLIMQFDSTSIFFKSISHISGYLPKTS